MNVLGSNLTSVRPRFPRLPQLATALALPLVNLGRTRLVLQTTPRSGLQYYVSLPQGWTPTRRWPLLVTIDGANHGFFLPHALRFLWARQQLPFILMTPFVVSNTGRADPSEYPYPAEVWRQVSELSAIGFDAAGLLEAVAAVCDAYSAEEQFFLTGWSAGGHLT